jgi:hypothetical protein
VQIVADASANVPPEQMEHDAAAAAENLPAGHNAHGEIVANAEYWPRGHGPQKSELSIRPKPSAHAAFRNLNALVSCDVSSPTDTATSSLLPLVRLREHVISVSAHALTSHGYGPTITAYSVLDSTLDVLLVPLASVARPEVPDTKPGCLRIKAS